MATVNFQLIGKNIYTTLSIGGKNALGQKNNTIRRKTGYSTSPEHWKQKQTKFSGTEKTSNKKSFKVDLNSPTIEDSKIIKSKLDDLRNFIINSYNTDFAKGLQINTDWLEIIIGRYNNQTSDENEFLYYHIQKAIDNGPRKKIPIKGGKFKIGLSTGRIKGIEQFRNIIERFENEFYNQTRIKVSNVSIETISDFENWLFNQSYSENYIGKQLANFKSILNDIKDVKVNIDTRKVIKVINEEKEPEDIIYLSLEELKSIKELELKNNYLENARKWLIIGCYVGQRASDLLELSKEKISIINDRKVFTIKQKKTGKKVTIPLLPEVEEMISSGFPHKISDTKLREYFKLLCKAAEINAPMNGRIKESKNGITTKSIFPKWQLIGTHVCRRSFASNFYGKIPTVVLKGITGHSTESMFLKYIGKTDEDFAMQMFDYVEKLPKTKTLKIIKPETSSIKKKA
ncbi:tyrosine-type recombinase/integrase [Empedobacter brevis]|uniref:tyrosine-type recombinase/integrase n=1 Tax=Empedobacter brevis TaxID=247 RepID=UPI0028AD1690|nr:phage integrase SAM-like domain-containing protein [Empedobacter brevis]